MKAFNLINSCLACACADCGCKCGDACPGANCGCGDPKCSSCHSKKQ